MKCHTLFSVTLLFLLRDIAVVTQVLVNTLEVHLLFVFGIFPERMTKSNTLSSFSLFYFRIQKYILT